MTKALTIPAPKTEPAKKPVEKPLLPEKKKDNEQNLCIQTKLTVGAPDDPYEKEADSVADSIMRMPQQNFVQRKCAECEKEDQFQRKPIVETISNDKISRKLSVENPDGMIPNPTGSGISQTNGQTVFDYINQLCPDTDWMMQDGRIELLDTNFCFPSEEQEDGSFKSPSQLSAHPVSCECLCETSMDPLDNIIIRINDQEEGTGSTNDNAGGTIINVPSPNAKESKVMGASGTMVDSPPFIILAHELCGHHLLSRHGNDNENMLNDRRGGHDPTINRENEIRSEHGIDQRGTFRDPCCGLGDNSPEGMEGTTHPCGKKFEEGLTKHRKYAYECKHWRDEYNRLNGTSFAVEDAIPIVRNERVPAQWRIEVYFNVDAPQSWLTLNQSLTEEGRTNLGTVENLLTAHPDWQTQLAGNASTDRPANDPDYNTRLAKRRVISIRDELLSKGVTNERMKTFDSDCETIQDGVHNCGDTIVEPRSNALDRNVEVKIFPPEQLQANNAAANSATPTTDNFIQRKCAHCEEEEKEQVQRKSFIQTKSETTAPSVSESLSQSIESSKGSGSSMDDSTQSFMSDRFDSDFSNVKIHTGNDSAQMNQQLNAKAFTTGNDIYFNEGQYQPHSDSGKQLLAHELTHVVQQGNRVQNSIQCKGRGEKDGNISVKWIDSDDEMFRRIVTAISDRFNVPESYLFQPVHAVYSDLFSTIEMKSGLKSKGKIDFHVSFYYKKGEAISKVDITIPGLKKEEEAKRSLQPSCALIPAPHGDEGSKYLPKAAAFYSRLSSWHVESKDKNGWDGIEFTVNYEGVDLVWGMDSKGSPSSKYQSRIPYHCAYVERDHLKPFFDAILITIDSYKPDNIYTWKIIFNRDRAGKMDFVKWFLEIKPKYPAIAGRSEADELKALGIPDRKQIYAQIFKDTERELKKIGVAIAGFTIEQIVLWVAGGILFKALGLIGKGVISAFPKLAAIISRGSSTLFAKGLEILSGAEKSELAVLMQKVEKGVLTAADESRLSSLLSKVEANLPSSLVNTGGRAASALSKIRIPKITSFTGSAAKFDAELVRKAAEIRATQAGLSLEAFTNYNVAVARVRTANGSIVYLEAGNLPGAAHSEEYILAQFKERTLGLGSGARVEQLYSERIPCSNCSSVISRFFGEGTEIYYTVGNQINRGRLLMEAYGL